LKAENARLIQEITLLKSKPSTITSGSNQAQVR